MINNKKHLYWIIALVLITIILCGTLLWINAHSWTLRFEMDNNTLEAVKSVNWTAIGNQNDPNINN